MWGRRVASLLRTLFRKDELNRELDAELESYVVMLAEEKARAGIPEAEARRQARLELGGVSQVKAEVADRRIGAPLDTLFQDARFALRQFSRDRGFAIAAVVTLALGIGANTAMFSVVNRVLYRPLPYAEEGRVVTVWNTHVDGRLGLSEQEFLEYRAVPELDALGVYVLGSLALSGDGEAERLQAAFASAGVFESLSPPLVAGRAIVAADDRPGAPPVVLVSASLADRRFGGEAEVVGRTILLNGVARTIVGVLPAEFRLPAGFVGPAAEAIVPLGLDPAAPDPRNIHYLNGVGRLAETASVGRAATSLDAAARRLVDRLGTLPETFSAGATPVRDAVVGDVRPVLLILLGAVALVLLVTCVNIANLLLARADARLREMAVRTSLGAGRARLVRQLCTETGVLALAGGIGGLALGVLGARALVSLAPPGLPRLDDIAIDPLVFGFCLAATLATGLLIGLLPALRLAREEPVTALRGTHRSTADGSRLRTRRVLVTAQVALAVPLAIGAGLLVRSLSELRAVDPGFEERSVLTFQISLPSADYPDAASTRRYFEALETSIAAAPGVEAVGGTTSLPLAGSVGDWGVRIRGRGPDGLGELGPAPDWMVVTPGYFAALGIPLVEGRPFTRQDATGGVQSVVISREFADRHWPDGRALGAQLRMSTDIDTLWRTIVGIAGDVRQTSLEEVPRPAMYLPHAQWPSTSGNVVRSMTLAARTSSAAPAAVAAAVRSAAGSLDPNVPVAGVRTLEDVTRDATADRTFQGLLFGGFAGLALVLVVVGVYGVTAYLVSRRTREIGIRIALGASPGGVRRLVLREGAAMTAAGLAIGLATAWMLSRLLSGVLYGVTARDAVTFAAVPVLLGATALLSAAIPAARAARVDPQEALRQD